VKPSRKPLKPNAENEARHTPKKDTLDFHRSPVEAVPCLIRCEGARLRDFFAIEEMACGDGALVTPLRKAGWQVHASDIVARGCPGQTIGDYLARPVRGVKVGRAGVTNPPFNRAEEFILKACEEFDYVAMVLRLRYLGAKHLVPMPGIDLSRKSPIWANTRIPFARMVVPDGRWSMMHRDGYGGPKTESGMIDFCWFVWDAEHTGSPRIIMEAQINAAAAAGRFDNAHV
jgi:hypothetical protein